MSTTRKHFVTFLSPGTFFSEQTDKPIPSWNTAKAVALAAEITERHGAKPYGFQFRTCIVADPVSDGEGETITVPPKEVERSGTHYLGGKLIRYEDVPESESILRSNMRCNGYPVVIENRNSWKFTGQFTESDCIVDDKGEIVIRGNDPELVAYRAAKKAEFEAYYANT